MKCTSKEKEEGLLAPALLSEKEGLNEPSCPQPEADPEIQIREADARRLSSCFPKKSVDLVVTSPPYWKARDYEHPEQIGQEETPQEYAEAIAGAVESWEPLLKKNASIFLNVGDSYRSNGSLAQVPSLIASALSRSGWMLRNRIIWAKTGGTPDPAPSRLPHRHEVILHLARSISDYYYDRYAYNKQFGRSAGDLWEIGFSPDSGKHLAPFPEGLPLRAMILACPKTVCRECQSPYRRETAPTAILDDTKRPQARRAVEIARESRLTPEHISSVRATGLSDAGKAKAYQSGSGRNAAKTQRLADEAKKALGGYFREFTAGIKVTVGWQCQCKGKKHMHSASKPGVVLDPFLGTGTTAIAAMKRGHSVYGSDLSLPSSGIQTSLPIV